MATRMVSTESWQLKNETCRSSVDLDLFLHYSLLPSVAIIMVLSCLEKRARGHQVDERFPLLNRRCGTVIPLDFVGAFDNRWSLGFAFGATANKVMIMFSEGDFLLYVPQWAQAFVLLIGAFEVGLSSYPFFACLSTCFQITGATLGFLYTGFWLVIMVMHIVQCPHGQIIGHYEKIMFYWPSLLCLVFLLSRFVHIFVKTLWIRFRLHLLNEETSFLEVHQAQYVQQLLRKPPLQQSQKSWIQRKVYDWDPYFRFPTRMISMAVLATICLYIFVVIEYYVYSLVLRTLKTLEENFEMLIASNSTSKVVVSGVQHGKELIGITEGVWVVTTFTSCLICVSYVFHILACYRKHMKRLWAGEKQFLPLGFSKLSSSQSVAAIARYSGWQIAYILWGQLVIHTVQCLFGVMFMYSFVLPIKKGQGIEMVKTLGTGILTLAVVIGLMLLQVVTAASFFLQPKISQDDKEKPLALDNRKVFHNFNYFLFFYNVLLGLGACLFRLLCSVIVGAWLIARIDRTIMPKGYEAADMGLSNLTMASEKEDLVAAASKSSEEQATEQDSQSLDKVEEKLTVPADQVTLEAKELTSSRLMITTEMLFQIVTASLASASGMVHLVKEVIYGSVEKTRSPVTGSMTSMGPSVEQMFASGVYAVMVKSEELVDHCLLMIEEELG